MDLSGVQVLLAAAEAARRETEEELGIRLTGERAFVRLRVLEGPEISEDPVLDAIEENGEIHTFLKNPAIARDVDVLRVGGDPGHFGGTVADFHARLAGYSAVEVLRHHAALLVLELGQLGVLLRRRDGHFDLVEG